MAEQLNGYAYVLGSVRCREQAHKPLIGKRFMRYGQLMAFAPYMMQLGALLTDAHRGHLDEFIHAFLGKRSLEPGGTRRYFEQFWAEALEPRLNHPMSFADYVLTDQQQRLNEDGDLGTLMLKLGTQKLSPDAVLEYSLMMADTGAAIAGTQPKVAREMFALQHAPRDQKSWDAARAAGVDLPPTQDIMSWDDAVDAELPLFREYCKQCCPDYLRVFQS